MRLLELDQIESGLDLIARSAPPGVIGLRMKPSNVSEADLSTLETRLGYSLPYHFRELLAKIDLGRFNLGGVAFCHSGDYLDFLLDENLDRQFPWWGGGSRPEDLILVAGTDGYVVLLNSDSGEVLAYRREKSWREMQTIARDFKTFFRAAGTLYLDAEARQKERATGEVSSCAGSDAGFSFWKQY